MGVTSPPEAPTCSATFGSSPSTQEMPSALPRATPPSLKRGSTLLSVLSESVFSRSSTLRSVFTPKGTHNTAPARQAFSLGSLYGSSKGPQTLPTNLEKGGPTSRDTLLIPSTATVLPTISPLKAFRGALARLESPTQRAPRDRAPRDREAIMALARSRSRRRSDAADDQAAMERAGAVVQKPRNRRASIM